MTNLAAPQTDEDRLAALAPYGAAASHGLRIRILLLMAAMDDDLESDGRMSPTQMLGRLPVERLGNISYHVRILRQGGFISDAGGLQRRGAWEHFYILAPSARLLLRALHHLDELVEEFA